MSSITTVADYFLICSADSQRQTRAIMDHIHETLAEHGLEPFSLEGAAVSQWVLMDYSDVVVHIFKQDVRGFYALERLWGDAPTVPITQPRVGRAAAGRRGTRNLGVHRG